VPACRRLVPSILKFAAAKSRPPFSSMLQGSGPSEIVRRASRTH
jgi:hypothetical protein